MFVDKYGYVRRTPNWVGMESIIGVWSRRVSPSLSPSSTLVLNPLSHCAGWHLPERCQHGEGLLNTQRGSKPWEERERRALFLERMSYAPLVFQPVRRGWKANNTPSHSPEGQEAGWRSGRALFYPKHRGTRESTQLLFLVRGQN